jgi:GDP-L-fucose synthase
MNNNSKIYVAGHRGLAGSALVARLQADGATHLVLRTHDELDLTDQGAVETFFSTEKPEYVFLAAAKVGGIMANSTRPAEFIYQNLAIQSHVIHNAWKYGARKLVFLGSSCIYPRDCAQPIHEEYLLTGPLEATNEAYAIAKIAGLKMCQAYRAQYGFDATSVMPTNLYGPRDNFNLENAHVLPALIRRIHEAKVNQLRNVTIWGTGTPLREFMHVDDFADAVLHIAHSESTVDLVNIGSGQEVSIAELARLIAHTVGYEGELVFDPGKPDGTPRKRLDNSRLLALGWQPKVDLKTGIERTYRWFVSHLDNFRA